MEKEQYYEQSAFWIRVSMEAPDEESKAAATKLGEKARFMARHDGKWGVYCQPNGHMGNSQFLAWKGGTYAEALAEANYMNVSNLAWHYSPKAIRE